MDQDKTSGPEKRNWREKLGIGTNGLSKDLPKISNDFKKEEAAAPAVGAAPKAAAPRAEGAAKPAVRPAPMAPRPGTAPLSRANPKPVAPSSPDKLAERLRSQREASAKLAEQRVQVARQRADVPPTPAAPVQAAPVSAGPKPKFSFAEDEANGAPKVPSARPVAAPARPAAAAPAAPAAVAPPQRPAAFQPQVPTAAPAAGPVIAPSRPALGGAPQGFTPARAPSGSPPVTGYPAGPTPGQGYQSPPAPGFQPQGYGQQPPGYRPIDPATGYPQQPYAPYGQPPGYQPQGRPPYVPNQRFSPTAQPPQGYVPPGSGPRLNVPQRPGLNPNYVPPEGSNFNAPPAGVRPPRPAAARAPEEYDDQSTDDGLFDEPAPQLQRPAGRRPTSVDYQQAYRDAEAGFEDEAPRSKLPWILPGILLLGVILAGLLVWGYQTQIKPMMNGTQQATTQQNNATNNDVPVVPAPTQPDKAQPDQAQQNNAAAGATRKQIYDRIVGDKEVLGGQMVPTEQAPAPQDGANAVPQPTDATGAGTGGAAPAQGGDAVPLPIPPPPGDNTQGALPDKPEDPNKQSAENVTPAAGESQAAVAVPAPGEIAPSASTGAGSNDVTAIPASSPPAPSDTQAANSDSSTTDTSATPQAEQITPAKPKAETPKKVAEAVAARKPKKLPKDKLANLGSKPVVLVPPSGKAKPLAQADTTIASDDTGASANGGLYGNNYVVDTPATTDGPAAAAPKKKKTLADLFNGTGGGDSGVETGTNAAPVVNAPAAPAPAVAAKPAAPKPAPVQVASAGTGGVVAQLASFKTNAEASAEYARLKSKFGATLNGLSPIITQADVAGTTRYRLAVGPFSSRDQANALCSKLFASGERDCLVRN